MENTSNQLEPSESFENVNPEHKAKLDIYIAELKLKQNLPLGIAAGLVAAIFSAAAWAAISVVLNAQIGFMAVGVGFLVGVAVRFGGKGIDNIFGISGAILALIGCLLGNIFTIIAYGSRAVGISFFEGLIRFDYSMMPLLLKETFSVIDLLFYGIAIYEGYRFSFRQVDEYAFMNNLKD